MTIMEFIKDFISDCEQEGLTLKEVVAEYEHRSRYGDYVYFEDGRIYECEVEGEKICFSIGTGKYHHLPMTYDSYGWSPEEEWYDNEEELYFDYNPIIYDEEDDE